MARIWGWRDRRFRFAVAGFVVTAALTTSFVSVPSSANATPDPVRPAISIACSNADIVLVAARGSGESPLSFGGAGDVMWSAYTAMADQASRNGRRVNIVTVDYEAQAVRTLLLFDGTFFRSINDGVAKTKRILQEALAAPACRDKSIVLGGYSQGAMVMHRVIGSDDGLRLAYNTNVINLLMVADGDRLANDYYGAPVIGGATANSIGIGQKPPFSAFSGSSPRRLDDNGRFDFGIANVCFARDAVCSPEYTIPPPPPIWCVGLCATIAYAWAIAGDVSRQIEVHTRYAGSPTLANAARAMVPPF